MHESSDNPSAGTAITALTMPPQVRGTQLRLVVTAPAIQRVLTLHGLSWLIPIYPSLAAATTAATLAAAGPVAPGPVGRIPRHRETMTGLAHTEAGHDLP